MLPLEVESLVFLWVTELENNPPSQDIKKPAIHQRVNERA